MMPVGIAGVLFKDPIEALFDGNLVFVGFMLMITASLLAVAHTLSEKGDRKYRI